MTAYQMQDIARKLSNQFWCRHWLHWNYPQQTPWLMALSVRDADGLDVEFYEGDVQSLGLRREDRDGRWYYVVERVDAEGKPFTSTL